MEGYDDPRQLVQDLVDQGLVERLTRLVPMGLVGPAVLNGNYLPRPLEKGQGGQLVFSESFSRAIYAEHGKYMQRVVEVNTERDGHGFGLGLTCPAAGKDGGVRKLSETMNSAYQAA